MHLPISVTGETWSGPSGLPPIAALPQKPVAHWSWFRTAAGLWLCMCLECLGGGGASRGLIGPWAWLWDTDCRGSWLLQEQPLLWGFGSFVPFCAINSVDPVIVLRL